MVFAMAAMVALASCTKTELVDNSAPTPISFKAVTGSMTKAEQATGSFTQNLGVFAFDNANNNAPYFKNHAFNPDNNYREWTGSNVFWPFQSSLDFVVYSPAVPGNGATYDANKLTVTGIDNSGKTTLSAQTDYLYGTKYFDGLNGAGYGSTTEFAPVNTDLKHALAKIQINFDPINVTIKSVSLTNPTLKGDYVVDYSTGTGDITWDPGDANGRLNLTGFDGNTVEIMVVPTAATNIEFTYTIDGTNNNILPATIDLSNSSWEDGNLYIYNITVSPKVIKFAPPKVDTGWGTGSTSDIEIE